MREKLIKEGDRPRPIFNWYFLPIVASLSIIFSHIHIFSSPYPDSMIVIHIAILCSIILFLLGRLSYTESMFVILYSSVAYRAVIVGVASGVFASDPIFFAESVRSVINTGTTESIQSGFYQSAPTFILLLTILGLFIEGSPSNGFLIFSGFTGILFPLLSAVIVSRLTRSTPKLSGLITASIVAVGWHSLHFSYNIIAQTFTQLVILVFIFCIILNNYKTIGQRGTILLLLLLSILPFVHKISVVLASIIVGSYFIFSIMNKSRTNYAFVCLMILVLMLQWAFLTGYISRIPQRILPALLSIVGTVDTESILAPTHAVNPTQESIYYRLLSLAHLIVLSISSGIAWLYIGYKNRDEPNTQFLLILSAFCVGIAALVTVFGSTLTPTRFRFLAEFIMAIVIGSGIAELIKLENQNIKKLSVCIGLISLIIFSQLIVPGAVPTDPRSPDRYITESENTAIEFSNYYLSTVYSDYDYSEHGEFSKMDEELFNKNVPNNEITSIAYRPGYETQRSSLYSGNWKLQWNPQKKFDRECLSIYNNDDVFYYICTQY